MLLSPNFNPRPSGQKPDMVVIHYTAMETAAAIARLCDPETKVSAHYVIDEAGVPTPLVAESERAWHAGAGQWGAVSDVNSHSIGIELANRGPDSDAPEFPIAQMVTLDALLARILDDFEIPPERVIAHSDMAPGRKADPGPYFDWHRLAQKGLSVWMDSAAPGNADWDRFCQAAHCFGYRPTGNCDDGWHSVLKVFRLRFRPFVSGPLDGYDVDLAIRLAKAWPNRSASQSPVDPGVMPR